MGRTGFWGPTPEEYSGPPVGFMYVPPSQTVVLTGAEIYKLSCRGCHKADGNGTPPEVPTIAGPVQATSAKLFMQRMAERGRPIEPKFARELAAGSKQDLLNRLKNGGQKMPAFGYLTPNEISALVGYLEVLANVPPSGKAAAVTEPAMRNGELLVKGTCHICHDASGNWPSPQQLMEGATPPIAGFTSRKSLPDFIWKVRSGAPILMGAFHVEYRGRMPVFDYLTNDEVSSAYMYLIHYPPN